DNVDGNSDVDGGPTRLISPVLDLSGAVNPMLSYARWFYNDDNDADRMDVELSDDDGMSWVLVESVPPASGWVEQTVQITSFVSLTATVRVRFSATDNPNNSLTEGGVDAVRVHDFFCGAVPGCATSGDLTGDSVVDGDDALGFVACFIGGDPGVAGCACADMDDSGTLESTDVTLFVNCLLGAGCP
ncbi:MAG: hypothetical protein V3T70_00835, partial [Phycisphaerae bacterium]